VQGIIQQQTSFNAVGLDHVLLIKVSVTATVSFIFDLSREEALSAVSHAFMDGHPLRTYRHAPNTGPRKGWAAARASSQAVELVLLAKAGQPAAPSVLTAPRWGFNDAILRGKPISLAKPFGEWAIQNIIYKMAPAEGHSLTAIEATESLVGKLKSRGLSPERDVEKVIIRTHAAAVLIIDKKIKLQNHADRDHDIRYIVAVTLLKGKAPEANDFADTSPWAMSKAVELFRQNMDITEDPNFTHAYLDIDQKTIANGVDLLLKDGTRLGEVVVQYPKGSAKRGSTFDHVKAKALENLMLSFLSDKADRIIKTVLDGSEDVTVIELVDLLWKGHPL
jgi:2-methylcitrate dehydratase